MVDLDINGIRYKVLDSKIERNSGGRLTKIWIQSIKTGIPYLVKGASVFGLEPYSEVMAYSIGQTLGFDVLEYKLAEAKHFRGILDRIHCKHVSVCRSLDSTYEYVTSITHEKNIHNAITGESKTNKEVMEKIMPKAHIDRLFLFDAVICNKDRHYRNVHIMKDTEGNYSPAPIFDNGDSLLATDILAEAGTLSLHLAQTFDKSSTIARTHTTQVKYITTINTSNIDTAKQVESVLASIQSTLLYLSPPRRAAIRKFLASRIFKFYGMFTKDTHK